MLNVMIDIETLGTRTDAVILSIGATKFNAAEIIDSFYVTINPRSCQLYGLTIDADTVMWWLHADRGPAREDLLRAEGIDLYDALEGFREWFGPDSLPTWGNGASFDNVLLRNAYTKTNIACPWKFWDDRCYRTMKNIHPNVTVPREGTHHNALQDAIYQTKHLMAMSRMFAQ